MRFSPISAATRLPATCGCSALPNPATVSDDTKPRGRAQHHCTEVMTVRAVYRNPIDSHGTATTIASATASAARYGHIRHNASSGETRPIAQAP